MDKIRRSTEIEAYLSKFMTRKKFDPGMSYGPFNICKISQNTFKAQFTLLQGKLLPTTRSNTFRRPTVLVLFNRYGSVPKKIKCLQ